MQFIFARFRILFPSRVHTSCCCFTFRERIKLTRIHSNYGFAPVCRISIKSLVHNSFPCKYNGWSTNHVFTSFLQQIFVDLSDGIKFCKSGLLKTNICKIWQNTSKLYHVNSFIVVKIIHLLPSFWRRNNVLVVILAQKVFEGTQVFLLPHTSQVLIVFLSS